MHARVISSIRYCRATLARLRTLIDLYKTTIATAIWLSSYDVERAVHA